jgi:hypothetical protein
MMRTAGVPATLALLASMPLASMVIATPLHAATPPAPSAFTGVNIGADRQLADYRQIAAYMRALAATSPRVRVESLGRTTLGEDEIMVVISSEANVRDLQRIKRISRALANPTPATDVDALARDGKAIVLVTCNIHATEIASSQMAMEWAYALATATDAATKQRLDNVVLLLVPSLDPDGQLMVTDWYRKYLGTKYEGGRMPWLYHHYVGHDNNRDWFMLTQVETRNLNRAVYHEWNPQVFVDEHQMGTDGPRMFIPPFADPIDPDVHPLIWREANLIGTNMAFRLEQKEKAGTISGYEFDGYWLGGTRNTGWWKNITGMLLETASARIASPIEIDSSELRGGTKGLVEYKATANHPHPWNGGTWRMRDIMDYERIASDALLETVAEKREDFLRDTAVRARAAIASAKPGEAYRIPRNQRDWPTAGVLIGILQEHNVRMLTDAAGKGDYWIPMQQPYAKFITELLDPQRYPEVRLQPGRDILRPYDVATWTLPLMMGVTVEHATLPASGLVDPIVVNRAETPTTRDVVAMSSAQSARDVNAAFAASRSVAIADVNGTPSFVIGHDVENGTKLRRPRVGIYKPWSASHDEGWTRWLLDTYGFAPQVVTPNDLRGVAGPSPFPALPAPVASVASAITHGIPASLHARLDALILPDADVDELSGARRSGGENGVRYGEELPPEYRTALDREGTDALRKFVEEGGTLIALAGSSNYVIQEFALPVRNALRSVKADDFSVPGSLLRIEVRGEHPITRGMPSQVAAFVDKPIAFETIAPGPEMHRWILATYPDDARDILLSGWINGQERLTRKAAAVAFTYGKGRIVLFGFRPQHRGQTHATFPLLFNAIYWSVLDQS